MSKKQLAAFDGCEGRASYVALRGYAFDVSSRPSMYARGKGYNTFVAKEASRAFAVGKVTAEVATDDLTGLEPKNIAALDEWFDFYMQRYPAVAVISDSRAVKRD